MTGTELKIASCPECGSLPETGRSCGGEVEWVACQKCDLDDETVTEWRDWIVAQDEDLARENELKVAIYKAHRAAERAKERFGLNVPAILAARERLIRATRAVYDPRPGEDRLAALPELAVAERAVLEAVRGTSRPTSEFGRPRTSDGPTAPEGVKF